MQYIKGYKFDIEQDAIDAVEVCNKHFGIVQNENLITQHYVKYIYDELGFFYIKNHPSLNELLGEPNEFEISDNKIFISNDIITENLNLLSNNN